MPSASKSSRPKAKKLKSVPKPKQPKRNWLDLPSDVMANIIQRIGVFDILENAQRVCTAWHKICKDPAMWRVIYLDFSSYPFWIRSWSKIYKNVVDRSQGQLVDITMVGFNYKLLKYITDRSCQLRRLEIAFSYGDLYESLTKGLKKFTLLEELSLYKTFLPKDAIETAGKYCPLLKILKKNTKPFRCCGRANDEIAIAIGKNLPELRHLELIGNHMSNIGLQAILAGCCHLEVLDLRRCFYLKGDIRKRCEQIKCLKLPNDSLEGCPFIPDDDSNASDISESSSSSDDSDESEDFTASDESGDFTSSDDDFADKRCRFCL